MKTFTQCVVFIYSTDQIKQKNLWSEVAPENSGFRVQLPIFRYFDTLTYIYGKDISHLAMCFDIKSIFLTCPTKSYVSIPKNSSCLYFGHVQVDPSKPTCLTSLESAFSPLIPSINIVPKV